MSNFFDKNLDELLEDKPTTEISEEQKQAEYEKKMRELYLQELAEMRDFSKPETHLIYPQPVGPKWKN